MTKENFMNGLNKLSQCFYNSPELKQETVKWYWEYLNDKFDDYQFNEAIEKIIKEERFFPTISVFFNHKPQFLSGAF